MTHYRLNIQKLALANGIRNAHQLQIGADLYARNARQLWDGATTRVELKTIEKLCDLLKCEPGDLFEKVKPERKKKA